jgi:hypothetical protein
MDAEPPQLRIDALAHLTSLERRVLQVAANDCPMQRKSLSARLGYMMRTFIGGKERWMGQPLANPTLEALRLFFCLTRRPDPVLMTVVRRQLSDAFNDRTLEAIAAEADASAQLTIPRTG